MGYFSAVDNEKPDFSNSAYLFPRINREGMRFGAIAVAITLAVAIAAHWAPMLAFLVFPLALLSYGVFLFFRDPDRYPPNDDPKAILSPADGRICLVQEVPFPEELMPEGADAEAWAKDLHWRVSVFMSVFNVHVNRLPAAGTIAKKAYVPGKFLNASLDKASKDNERCAYMVETLDGTKYATVQIAGLVAKRIVPFVEEGAALARAERFGLIRFGSRLDVYLPAGVKPEVRLGQIMVSGETVLGHFA